MSKIALITGTSSGIGKATALKFLKEGWCVIGLDIKPATIVDFCYSHFVCDVSKKEQLPHISDIDLPRVIVNNAGTDRSRMIEVNLKGSIYVTEKYLTQKTDSVIFVASASARTGAENPLYAASKGGMVAYMKNVASRIAKWGGTSNAISPGGVRTPMNDSIMNSPSKMKKCLAETETGRWACPEEIAEWIYFVSAVSKSMTAQDLLIDNGEEAKFNFIQ
jgi:3-oxoacyl-[acyl-carrier protein] reductase